MKIFGRKFTLLMALATSLLGVTVAAISTLAWFQINTTTDKIENDNTVKSGSPNLTIDNSNVTGYKIQPTLGTDGFPYYGSSTVSSKKGGSYDTSNHNQDVADYNFDVPADGLGYYLIKKNPSDTYKYKYNETSYSWKFKESDNSSVKYSVLSQNITVLTTDMFIVRNYSYNSSEYKTVNEKVAITKDQGNIAVDEDTYEISPTTAGTYKVWLYVNGNTKRISFELVESLPSKNRSSLKIPGPKRLVTDGKFRINVFVDSDNWAQDNIKTYFNAYSSGNQEMGKDSDLGNADSGYTNYNSVDDADGTAHRFQTVEFSARTAITKNGTTWVGRSSNFWNGFETSFNLYTQFRSHYWDNTFKITGTWDNFSATLVGWYNKVCLHTGLNFGTTSYIMLKSDKNPSVSDQNTPSGYTFVGWYKESSLTNSFDGTTNNQYSDINLYAKYEKNGGANTTYNIKLFLNGNTDWGTPVYCYAYGGSGKYSDYSNAYIPANYGYSAARSQTSYTNGETGATVNYYIYSFNISTSFPNVIFRKYNYFNANCDQTEDLTGANTHEGDTFVITGGGGSSKWSGSWYASISGISTTTKDYYIYDQAEYLDGSGTPYVYVWKNNVTGDGTNTFYMPHNSSNAVEKSAWPGITLLTTDADGTTPLPAHMYRFRVSETYDSFILNNGLNKGASGAFQTQDLSLSNKGQAAGTARSASTYYFVFSGAVEQQGGYYEVSGDWIQNIGTISLKVAFAIYDGSSYNFLNNLTCGVAENGLYTIKNDFYVSTVPYKPTLTTKSDVNSGNDFVIADGTNGIVYNFSIPSGSLTWYKDTSWSETFDTSDGETGYVGDLYVRAVCDIRDYVDIYVDDASWSNENLAVKTSGNDATYFTADGSSSWRVATGLYRITLRNDWIIQLSSGSNTNYNLVANDGGVPNMGSGSNAYYRTHGGNTYDYLYISSSGAGSSWAWAGYKSTSATNVWVQKYANSTWTNVANAQLLHGDGVGNDYILESGLQLTNGDVIRVKNNTTGDTYGYSAYVSGNTSKHTYIKTYDSGNAMQITRLGAADETARFNFYITHAGEVSIAMVPDFGNGYYIMEYNNTDGVENFIGAIKMDSSDYSASYDGYYCSNTSTKIFVRSYLNAVDTLCDSLTSTSLSYVNEMDANSCIQFKTTGHYNIRVTNSIVDISPYSVDDFFSLNRLNSSLVAGQANNNAKQQEIWRQQTAVVMEIPFVANNPYDAKVKLRTVCSASYVGVRFAVYASKQSNPYDLMRGNTNALYTSSYLTDASTTTPIADTRNVTINAGTSGTYYAYVLIDYRYTVTAGNLISSTPEVALYLQIVQS